MAACGRKLRLLLKGVLSIEPVLQKLQMQSPSITPL
jgi:hypothetical protein